MDRWSALSPDRDLMRKTNPRFVLRQWVLEEVIKKVEAAYGQTVLQNVLTMALDPTGTVFSVVVRVDIL